eukprot:TRINITY_DN5675_c0_g1_i1.p1 TRINITY_DN5675_c0_g1~~TRINITY_DN5675_c0_g1_i1.p1  ORF type:complete len:572 (+),score=122.30 TRINITY_DN5675_c0_g1_i1:56-1771(+)
MLHITRRIVSGSVAPSQTFHSMKSFSSSSAASDDLLEKGDSLVQLKKRALELPSLTLTPKQLCDIELILNGAFAPLDGFMTQATYSTVLATSRLPSGALWPVPITLDITKSAAGKLPNLQPGSSIALRDLEGDLLAVLDVEDIYEPDRTVEANAIYGTTSADHPGVALLKQGGEVYLGGKIKGAQYPVHYDYKPFRRTPAEMRSHIAQSGFKNVLAFQTRSPIHKAQLELLNQATADLDAHLLIQSVAGSAAPGDVDHHTRAKAIRSVLPYFKSAPTLNMFPLAMRVAGKREALLHALVQKNYGATHIVIGPNHADTYLGSKGGCYEAQDYVRRLEPEIGIKVHAAKRQDHHPSDLQIRELIQRDETVPATVAFPEVVSLLRITNPPRSKQGFTLFFTGLSGSGKSTVANAVIEALREIDTRPITLLDGDVVRTNLSSELGFSREHRDINIRRLGYVSSEITKNGGISICAPIAPYSQTRGEVRRMIEPLGGFMEIWISTPLSTCEARDRKGLYAKARKGLLKGMTGIDDPYEAPVNPELNIDTTDISIGQAVEIVVEYLKKQGYVGKNSA